MLYYQLFFGVIFLPVIIILYKFLSNEKRWWAILFANLIFYASYGKKVFISFAIVWMIAYICGLVLDKLAIIQKEKVKSIDDRQEKKKIKAGYKTKSKLVMVAGIVLSLASLIIVKYTGLLNSLGMSFYTMQAIGYIVDVYWKKIPVEKNPLKLLTFFMFFLTIIEGPISAYSEMRDKMFEGHNITFDSIYKGYTRLLWGCMKKLVIADRIAPAVVFLYTDGASRNGFESIAAAVLFTIMEYMDFSGCMDMVCGIGVIFGIEMPENFRQPFLAKNASEFWRRWHITLGVWFRTYIFYPVSMSGLVKKWTKFSKEKNIGTHASRMVVSAVALLPVWLGNGFWHGPKSTYIIYGLYYFAIIMLELIFEPVGDKLLASVKLEKESRSVTVVRILKTWIVIFVGELIFRAETFSDALSMMKSVFTNPGLSSVSVESILEWGMDKADWLVVFISLVLVIVVNLIRERGVNILQVLLDKPVYIRYTAVLGLIILIMVCGLYGPGHQEVDLIYANF